MSKRSLVGPRTGSELRRGLAGPWRQAEDPKKQAVLDLYDIRNYSLWLDLRVLFKPLASHLGATIGPPVRILARRVGETRA